MHSFEDARIEHLMVLVVRQEASEFFPDEDKSQLQGIIVNSRQPHVATAELVIH